MITRSTVDFSPLLADVMTIADECDSQLKQTTNGFIGRASQVAARDVPRIASAINREARR
jgi:ornithine carbamoyltransferase